MGSIARWTRLIGAAMALLSVSVAGAKAASGVYAWGRNTEGQLGPGDTSDRSAPAQVVNITVSVIAVATGTQHSLALTSTGKVYAWGSDRQLGNGVSCPHLLCHLQ